MTTDFTDLAAQMQKVRDERKQRIENATPEQKKTKEHKEDLKAQRLEDAAEAGMSKLKAFLAEHNRPLFEPDGTCNVTMRDIYACFAMMGFIYRDTKHLEDNIMLSFAVADGMLQYSKHDPLV